jgi:hypothetical protein
MAYTLWAIIGRQEVLERHLSRYRNPRAVPIRQGMAIIPLSEALIDEINHGRPQDGWDTVTGFYCLTAPVVAWVEDMSRDGAVAYLEIECFGGHCDRGAIVWENGKTVLGPLPVEEDPRRDYFYDDELRLRDPEAFDAMNEAWMRALSTNRALRRIGVSQAGTPDEFNAVGLGRHRDPNDWLASSS